MAKVNLTLGESKSADNLTLEGKGQDLTWDEATMSWEDQEGTLQRQKISASLESKSAVSLTLESK